MIRKGIALIVMLLFIGVSIIPSSCTKDVKQSIITTFNDGNLSGFVNDTSMNPIEGVLVRVYFHGIYEEDYTDSTGYYHITNITICNCTKNCTASKVGYKTKWVYLWIYKNTKYDFVLSPSDVYPIFNGTVGDNGWFISPVNVSFVYNPEIVVKIYCSFVGNYTEPFVIYEQGAFTFQYKWLDIWGNWSFGESRPLKIDYTQPTIKEVEWVTYKDDGLWYCRFTCNAVDSTSGMDRVEFLVHHHGHHNGVHKVINGSGPIYEFVIEWIFCFCKKVFTFEHYDVAGNSAYDSINESEITSFPINNNRISFNGILERFPIFQKILDVLRLNIR